MRFIRLLKHDLASEAKQWVRESIVSRDQAELILARYGTSLDQPERKGLGYYTLLALAALSCGIAVLLLVSHNWASLPKLGRVLILAAATFGLQGGGCLALQRGREHLARLQFIVGSLMYGATIFLIAQIYHLELNYPPGILWWAIGIIPIALASRSVVVALLSVLLSTLWVVVIYTRPELMWWMRSRAWHPILPTDVYLVYPVLIGSLFYFSVVVRRSLSVFLTSIVSVIVVSEIVVSEMLGHDLGVANVVFAIGAQLLVYALGGFLERVAKDENIVDYGIVLRLWAMRFAVFTLFIFSFDEPWREFLRAAALNRDVVPLVALALLVPTALLAGLTPQLARRGSEILGSHIPQVIAFSFVYIALVMVAPFALGSSIYLPHDSNAALVGILCSNLLLLLVGVWYLAKGMQNERTTEVMFGTSIILVLGLVRYFDLIGGYVGTATLFLVEAAVMFGVARAMSRYSRKSVEQ